MEVKAVNMEVDLENATLIAGVMGGLVPAPGSESCSGGHRLLVRSQVGGFEGKPGQVFALASSGGQGGPPGGNGRRAVLRDSEGSVWQRRPQGENPTCQSRSSPGWASTVPPGPSWKAACSAAYQYRVYKTEGDPLDVVAIDVVDAEESVVAVASLMAESTVLARDWVNTPAVDLSPERFAELIAEAAGAEEIEVEIWDRERIHQEKMGALLGVAAGSDRDPRLVILRYRPEGATKHLALVGKGITFDSGGLSIKTAPFMEEMKDDMSGAAAVAAATIGIARLGIPVTSRYRPPHRQRGRWRRHPAWRCLAALSPVPPSKCSTQMPKAG